MLNPQTHTSGWPAAPWLAAVALRVLRVIVAYMFILHGTSKLFGVPQAAMFDSLHLLSLEGFASVLETFGGILIVLGGYECFVRIADEPISGGLALAPVRVARGGRGHYRGKRHFSDTALPR